MENIQIKIFWHDKLMDKLLLWLIPRTVKPNHFTVIRFILTPVVFWLLLKENYAWGVPLFMLTAFTDTIDGSLARTRGQITPWGIVYDPLADKLLIGSVIILIIFKHLWPVIGGTILGLEALFIIGGWLKKRRGQIIPANNWGKLKMVSQVLGVFFVLISLWLGIGYAGAIASAAFIFSIIFALLAIGRYGFTF